MKTISVASVVILVLSFVFTTTVEAQIPKEGTISLTAVYAGTYKSVGLGPERYYMTYEHTGVLINDAGEGILHNATIHCLGGHSSMNGNYDNDSGFCTATCPDGDKAFFTYTAAGNDLKGGKQISTYVGGTGKLAGLKGSTEVTRFVLRSSGPPGSPYQGPYQGMSKAKGQYKLP